MKDLSSLSAHPKWCTTEAEELSTQRRNRPVTSFFHTSCPEGGCEDGCVCAWRGLACVRYHWVSGSWGDTLFAFGSMTTCSLYYSGSDAHIQAIFTFIFWRLHTWMLHVCIHFHLLWKYPAHCSSLQCDSLLLMLLVQGCENGFIWDAHICSPLRHWSVSNSFSWLFCPSSTYS